MHKPHIHTKRSTPQMAADVPVQAHIFSAQVVSNCSQAIQIRQSVNE